MCRNIKPLFNYDPPSTVEDARSAAVQYVRKISGFTKPSKANQEAFGLAVDKVTAASVELLTSLVTNAPLRNRELELEKARLRTRR